MRDLEFTSRSSRSSRSGGMKCCSDPPFTRAGGQDDVSSNKLPQIIYPPPCLVHCWCVWALSNNLNHQCSILILIWMVLGVLHCPLRGPAPQLSHSLQRPTPPDAALIFRCSFVGPDFSQMVPQSEYSSDLGAQKAPFWLPFWSPFWVRLQK